MIDIGDLDNRIKKFIWSFKVYDNVKYNFRILVTLYECKQDSSVTKAKYYLNKPLIIIHVSIIEALLHDFYIRLFQSTNHFPSSIPMEKRKIIQAEFKAKNLSMDQLIKCFNKYELLGSKSSAIYPALRSLNRLRNRIHILNWYANFERDEHSVFTNNRLATTEKLTSYIINYISNNYARP
jgi:hypothetical protein